jgi:hypothetical protein
VTESGETARAVFSDFNYPERPVCMDGRLSKNAEGRGKRRESLCNTNLSLSRPGYWNLFRHIFECLEIYSGDIALLESLGICVTIYNPERRLFPFMSGRRVRAFAALPIIAIDAWYLLEILTPRAHNTRRVPEEYLITGVGTYSDDLCKDLRIAGKRAA